MPRTRQPLTRDRILNAALSLADEEGLAALSMRKVAAMVDVEAMSLYNHIANKADIIDGITDLVAGEIDLPTPDFDWKGEMKVRSQSAHRVLMRHPWAATQFQQPRAPGPHMMTYIDATLGCLAAVGFQSPGKRAWLIPQLVDGLLHAAYRVRHHMPCLVQHM